MLTEERIFLLPVTTLPANGLRDISWVTSTS